MAVNRFDQPAQAQFINTYVPIPFEQMMKAGQAKQQRYDETAAAMDQSIINSEQLAAIPNSLDEAYIHEVRRNMYDIRDKYADKDLSDAMVRRQLNNEINTRINKERVNKIQQSYAGYQNYQKQKSAMKARGEEIYGDVDFTNYDSFTKNGVFTGLPTMDLSPRAEQAIDAFLKKPEISPSEKRLPSGRIAISHARSAQEMENLIANESGELINNPAIQQMMERMNLDSNIPEDVEQFKDFLRGRAPSYLTEQWTSTYADERGGGDPTDPAYSPEAEATRTETVEVGTDRYRKAISNHEEMLNSQDPVVKQLAEDNQILIDYVEDSIDKEYAPKYDAISNEAVQKIMQMKGLPRDEAELLFATLIADESSLRTQNARTAVGKAGKAVANIGIGEINVANALLQMPGTVGDILKNTPGLAGDLITGNPAAYTMLISQYQQYKPERAVEYLEMERNDDTSKKVAATWFRENNNIQREHQEKSREAVTDVLNTTTQTDFSLEGVTRYTSGMTEVVSPAGGRVPSQFHKYVGDIFGAPDAEGRGYDVMEIKQYDAGKGSKKANPNKIDISRYTPMGLAAQVSQRAEDEYSPVVKIQAEDPDTKSKIEVSVRLTNPDMKDALIFDQRAGGRHKSAFRIKYDYIEREVDKVNFSSIPVLIPITGTNAVITQGRVDSQGNFVPDSEGTYYEVHRADNPERKRFIDGLDREALKNAIYAEAYNSAYKAGKKK